MSDRNLLQLLNRSTMKKQAEQQTEERARKRGPWLIRNIKWIMFVFFNLVVLVFDGLALSTVYTITDGNILLTSLSLLPTGIPMFIWEGGWLYPLADRRQKMTAIWGVILSVFSAVLIGILSVVIVVFPTTEFYVSAALLIWCVLAVVTHGIMAALYFYKDPIIQRDHELQKTIAENEYQKDTLAESEALLKQAEIMLQREQDLRARFGESEVNRALEILLGIDLNGDGKIGKPVEAKKPPLPASQMQNMAVYPSETENVAPKPSGRETHPTKGGESRP